MSDSHEHEELHESDSHGSEAWLDRNFGVLLILFGLIFVTVLVSFKPTI
jgi:hypothetical protein